VNSLPPRPLIDPAKNSAKAPPFQLALAVALACGLLSGCTISRSLQGFEALTACFLDPAIKGGEVRDLQAKAEGYYFSVEIPYTRVRQFLGGRSCP